MGQSYDYRTLQEWDDYDREWFWYKMDKTSEAIGSCGPCNNPCMTCSYPNCTFCPAVRYGDDS